MDLTLLSLSTKVFELKFSLCVSVCLCLSVCLCHFVRQAFVPKPLTLCNKVQSVSFCPPSTQHTHTHTHTHTLAQKYSHAYTYGNLQSVLQAYDSACFVSGAFVCLFCLLTPPPPSFSPLPPPPPPLFFFFFFFLSFFLFFFSFHVFFFSFFRSFLSLSDVKWLVWVFIALLTGLHPFLFIN